MAWIESHQELWRHPKTKKLARLLGVSVPTAIGHLHGLWYWALDFAQDGSLAKYEPEEIADAVLWDGKASDLMTALIAAGYIDQNGDVLSLHDWYDYAGKLLDRRAADRERKRKASGNRQTSEGVPTEIHRKADGNLTDSMRTVPNSTVPDSTLPNTTETETHTPDGDDIEVKEKPQDLQTQRFLRFWSEYPKKVGKKAALGSWKRIKPDAALFDKIMAAVEAAKGSRQWQRDDGQYIPNPATWLNQGRWDDELEEVKTHGTGADKQHTEQNSRQSFNFDGWHIAQDDEE